MLLASAAAQNFNPPIARPAGLGKFIKINPESLTFGSQTVGTEAASKTVSVTNTSTAPITISDIVTTGIDFSQTNTCSQSLAAGASCAVQVTFKPAVTGERMATLQIDDSDPMSPQTIVLTGTGQ
jgi:hypothetical protein